VIQEARRSTAAEWLTSTAPVGGRTLRQYTTAAAHSYPLYYFVPSVTDDGRYLVFHSERTGDVQLHRLDLRNGHIDQMTTGATSEAGWAIWCEPHLDGIYNHLSALDPRAGVVYYFTDEQIRAVTVASLQDRLVVDIHGRIPIGQSCFSPNGSTFAFIDADRDQFTRAVAERERLERAGEFNWAQHDEWRRSVPTRICSVDTTTGKLRVVRELDFHVHHLLFLDDHVLLVNHERSGNGMWTQPLHGGSDETTLRPADEHGRVCHQVLTEGGLRYETSGASSGHTWLGSYDLASDTWEEWELPGDLGYVHTGNDPAGRLPFIEACSAQSHGLYLVDLPERERVATVQLLHPLNPDVHDRLDQQRHHAHPFLGPDGTSMFFTDVVDGYSQIFSLDVSDLVGPAQAVESRS